MIFSVNNDVFCDHLSVTYSPENEPSMELQSFLLDIGATAGKPKKADALYRIGLNGMVIVWYTKRFCKIEATGQALDYLRSMGLLDEYLTVLSTCPHNITRLDAAMDIPEPYHLVRDRLVNNFPDYRVRVGRKYLQANEVGLKVDPYGNTTSTYYIGRRGSGKMHVRVYNKQNEVLEGKGEIAAPLTRVELELAREYQATLKDASDPTTIFYHALGKALFCSLPSDLLPWMPDNTYSWKASARPKADPYQKMLRIIADSEDLRTLALLSERMGKSGTVTLMSLLGKYFDPTPLPSLPNP